MDYSRTLNEIYDLQKFAIKLGLHNITALSAALGNPHLTYPVVHIAGTNGKGSTAFFLSRILQAAGLKTGLFTSPHLVDYRERITVNGRKISRRYIMDFWRETRPLIMQRKATFFDTSAALAFDYFRAEKVDVAIIETGLGGRLDSTNIVRPHMAVITPIHFDHQKQLGDTLAQIAAEKAGIIKKDVTVLSAPQDAEVQSVLKKAVSGKGRFYVLTDSIRITLEKQSLQGMEFTLSDLHSGTRFEGLKTRQSGDFQLNNMALAYLAAKKYLELAGLDFKNEFLKKALAGAQWPGRLQLVQNDPPVLFDVSHNPQGIHATMDFIRRVWPGRIFLLLGLVEDKHPAQIVARLAKEAERIMVTEPNTHRRLPAETLAALFKRNKKNVRTMAGLTEAYRSCRQRQEAGELLLVMGSHYLIGELLKTGN